jgi:thiamine biosynthesis lipoprotein
MNVMPAIRRLLVLLCTPLLAAQTTRFHTAHPAMGTIYTIDLYANSEAQANQVARDCFDEVDRIEALLSNYRPSSELSRISREGADGSVTTDPETFAFLETSFDWSRRSGGAFDLTVGPLMRTWGFFYDHGEVPSDAKLRAAAEQFGWQRVVLDPATRSIHFADHRRMELDPGGIGKGYAVDRIVTILRQQHVTAALISAGTSTIYALGAPPEAAGWSVRVPDPANAARTLSTVVLRDTSLSTSGCTEKFFIQNGHRYCHILDPRTLRPVEGTLQTTVIAPSATDSDALSLITFVMKSRASAVLLQELPETGALIVEGMIAHPVYYPTHWPDTHIAGPHSTTGNGLHE